MPTLLQDIRYALRQMRKSPGITLIAVMTLALGIGANTGIFELTWAVILKSLPVPQANRLVDYVMDNGKPTTIGLSYPEYRALQEKQKDCSGLLAWASDIADLQKGGHTEKTRIQLWSGSAFDVLRLRPYLGHSFGGQTGNRVYADGMPALLSYRFWRNDFHGSDHVLGQAAFIGGHPVTIVGVMPRGFEGLTANFHPDVYLPLAFENLQYGAGFLESPKHFGLYVMGRLRSGVTVADAQAEVRVLAPSIRKEADPTGIYLKQFFKSYRLRAKSGRSGISWVKEVYSRPLFVLEMLVTFLLALCSLNTGLVMMARVAGRRHEYAVRRALGASRSRLIRQILAEALLLAVPGLIGGIFIGWMVARVMVSTLGSLGSPSAMHVQPNLVVTGVNLAAGFLIVLGAGLMPALRAARTEPSFDLKENEHRVGSRHVGGWAISLQVAVSLCLVSTALLLGTILSRLLMENSGFQPRNAVIARIGIHGLKLEKSQQIALTSELLTRVKQEPGVHAAGYIDREPLSAGFGRSRMFSVDRDHVVRSAPNLIYLQATPDYFSAAGTGIVAGKSVAAVPGAMQHCVLSHSLARYFFPHGTALNQLVYASSWPQPDGTNLSSSNACLVTAVVEDAKFSSLTQAAPQILYGLYRPDSRRKRYAPSGIMVVRANSDSLAVSAIRDASHDVMPPGTSIGIQTFRQAVDQNLSRQRMLAGLSGAFAILAMLLTALGLYGLLMRSVTLRTREIGIRIAMGAQRAEILKTVGLRVLVHVMAGVVGGTLLAIVASRAVLAMLAKKPSVHVGEWVASVVIILLVTMLAGWLPARRAARVDPMEALRNE